MMSAQLQQSSDSKSAVTPPAVEPTTTTTQAEATTTSTTSESSSMKNRAGQSKSPFVKAHAESPVTWQLFNEEAVSRAKSENKLIFLSIGFSASHYCHLTNQDSFSNKKVSSLLNKYFVPIIIDREERPDIDSIYMSYIHSLNNAGGWPLNVFLTPELEPVFGGTYLPGPGVQHRVSTGEEGGEELPDFLVILEKMQSVWPEQEARVRAEAKNSLVELRKYSGEGTLNTPALAAASPTGAAGKTAANEAISTELDLDQLMDAYELISSTFDPINAGFGNMPPKFYTPGKLSLLLRSTRFPLTVSEAVGEDDCVQLTRMALHTLRRMVVGGVHDHLGKGFHRNSVTRDWSLPSFEKLLADNALLLGLYLDAMLLLGGDSAENEFRDTVFELGDYLTSAPILIDGGKGGFATSEAADTLPRRGDSSKREGAYYLWTRKEFDAIIGDVQEAEIAAAWWDVQEHGNVDRIEDPNDEFLNQNVLRVVGDAAELAKQSGIAEAEVKTMVQNAKSKLTAHREKERPKPSVDTKVVVAYNGIAITNLARAGRALCALGEQERGAKYLNAAKDAAGFLKKELWDGKVLYRFYADGKRSDTRAFAEDYAFLIEGLIELYEALAETSWLEWAHELQGAQTILFYDSPASASSNVSTAARCGAFYTTPADAPHVILRLKDAMDTSQPSANAVSASNLFRLASLAPEDKPELAASYTIQAKETINAFEPEMLQHPNLFPGLLISLMAWQIGAERWAYVGDGAATGTASADALKELRKMPSGSVATLRFLEPGAAGGLSEGLYIGDKSPAATAAKAEGETDTPSATIKSGFSPVTEAMLAERSAAKWKDALTKQSV